jgi:hypothetical protein
MKNEDKENKLLENLNSATSIPIELIDNYRKPNIQFIRQAKQISRRANDIVTVFERFSDSIKVTGLQSASIRTGSGFMINTAFSNQKNFNRDYIVEIIDFDPVRNNMMAIGNDPPAPDAALHWFIYRSFPEKNGIIVIDNLDIASKLKSGSYPVLDLSARILNLDLVLKVLKEVKNSEITLLNGIGVLIVGRTINDAVDLFNIAYEKCSKKDD